ncbi:aminodeoxychorismate lyase [Pseudidiomarina homiensis]|uniref:Aminodeoxychorismate lyase n=1 Tax=Pseudidiomarina homiensis TaxID=364198 RepID=A0A432Y4D8_9GAMM|nr:aminodeoxychorismate lyase [Pseudidiomarina homiensis]RUO55761.1 aminodeoxychorismate lyase [Pseudidiomarina homiensis]
MWQNGQQITAHELDRGLQFGDGHFTTLTRENGQLRWWPQHWQRLVSASERLRMGLPDEAEVLECLAQIDAADAIIKIIITRGSGSRGYGYAQTVTSNWYVTSSPLPERKTHSLNCAIAQFSLARSSFFAGLKTLNRLEQVMLSAERDSSSLDELIVCDSEGLVVEATSSNIFLRIEGAWHTPKLDFAGIDGIVRRQILADRPLGDVQISRVNVHDLPNVEQAFVTNTVLGLRPLAKIGDHKLPEQQLPKALTTWWQS